MSLQYLEWLLDEGKLIFTRTEKDQLLRLGDVLTYKQVRDRERDEALNELVRLSEELGLHAESKK